MKNYLTGRDVANAFLISTGFFIGSYNPLETGLMFGCFLVGSQLGAMVSNWHEKRSRLQIDETESN